MNALILLADLALTVFVYCSPAAVYRFLIRKERAEKKYARNFCIISSIIVYLLFLVIYLSAGFDIIPNVAAAAIWGFVSYRILLYEDKPKGKTNTLPTDDNETAPTELSIFDSSETPTEKDATRQEEQQSDPLPHFEQAPLPDTIHEIPIKKKFDGDTLTVVVAFILLSVFALSVIIYLITEYV